MLDHEPTEGVTFSFGRFPNVFFQPQNAVDVQQRSLGLKQVCEFIQHGVHHFLVVEFVGDVSHNFFQDVLQRDQPTGSTVLVHHNGHVDFLRLEFPKEVVDFFAFWDVHRCPQDGGPVEVVLMQGGQQVFDVKDADDLVGRPFVHGDAAVA